ncbi:DNA polymerase [Candidatus Gracilibacteria bacterium]|nr:DNA polymerase [Candidatus Gracilibacteria bacterium]
MSQIYDTLLGEYIQNPGARGLGLDKIASRDMNYEMISYDDMTQKGRINFKDIPLKDAADYSAEDVYITAQIYKTQKEKNITNNSVLQEIENPLVSVLTDIELTGVYIDPYRLKGIGIQLEQEITRLQKEIHNQAGEEFNIQSPKQVGEVLFEKMNLPKGKKTKTGYSVSAEVLSDLAKQYPIAQNIVEYRHYSKLLSTYVEGILDILKANNLVHTSYNSAVTTTGRLSSTKPNLQNIPVTDGIAGEIRDAFISRFEEGKIMAIDYSQIEVRLLAIMSEDKNLLDAFKNNIDIHQRTGEFVFATTNISTTQRKIAKAINFGVIYGISGFGLSKMIDANVGECNNYIKAFYDNYPQVKTFYENLIEKAKKDGYVETLFHRKRYLPNLNDSNAIIANAAKREAINMPIQGSNADIIKKAMIQVYEYFKKEGLKSKMIMQVHDELVFDVFPGEEDILQKNITNIMENIIPNPPIPLKADVAIGKSWRDCK